MGQDEFISTFDSLILNPETRRMYGQEEFFNVGYWLPETQSQQEACFNLMEKLLEWIPTKKGIILDAGSGLGATTRYLLKYYSPNNVVGINISTKQIERSIANAPSCNFICMDAAQIEFEDALFDAIVCVEAAFYFDTREKFLKEAWRVLKPGGSLILSDLIFKTTEYFGDLVISQNIVNDVEEYKGLYQQAGFQQTEYIDVTDECWTKHFQHLKAWFEEELHTGQVDEQTHNTNVVAIDRLLSSSAIAYWLVSAKKPVN